MTTSIDASVWAGVSAAISAYAHALDAGRNDKIAELFTPDGTAEIAGVGTFQGRDAIREGYAAFAPSQPQLHLVANTVITTSDADTATAVSNLAFIARGETGWAPQMIGRYDDELQRDGGTWRFSKRVTTFEP
jgi:uncharacterized protein (TIGR02246 family)